MTDRITRLATARQPVARAARNAMLGMVGRLPPMEKLAMNLSGLATDPARGRGRATARMSGR